MVDNTGGYFIKRIFVMTVVFILLFPNISDTISGASKKDYLNNSMNNLDDKKNDKKDFLNDVNLNAPRLNNGLADTPWPMFRHDLNHTGRSQYDTTKNNGQKKWDYATGSYVSSSPTIASDGTIYIGSQDGKLYALFPNGTKKWDFTTHQEVVSSPAIGSDGTIYTSSSDGKLYALFANGTKKWDVVIGYFVSSSPAINSDGTIYVGSGDGKIYALFPNGTKKWDFATGGNVHSSPAIGSDGTIYVGSDDKKLYALYPNGTKKWNFITAGIVDSSPAIGSDGTIYVGSDDRDLYALNSNGTKKWVFPTTVWGGIHSSPAIGSDGTIYVGSGYKDGKLYALFPNGTKKWNLTTGDEVSSSPAIGSDGTIYFGSVDHKIYAVFPNGTKKWDFNTGNQVRSSPAIGLDGTIYVGSMDYKLYAIGFSNLTAPQDLQAIGGNAKIDLNWTAPRYIGASAITNYTIYKGTTSGCETFLVKIGHVLAYQDNSVTNGKKYYYEVTANNTFGESPRSYEANATPATMPAAPQNLTAIPGNAKIALNWTVPADNGGFLIMNFTVYRNGSRLKVLGYVNTYTDSGLVNGVTYSYNISAMNGVGEGPKSIGVNATPRTVPSAPRDLHVSLGNAQIALNWTAPAENGGALITNYTVYRNGTRFRVLGNVLAYTDSGLVNGVTYVYNISALNSGGEGPKSIGVIAIPRTVPTAPRSLHATLGNAQIGLTWIMPASNGGATIVNYSIYRGSTSGGETLFIKGYIGGTSWVDSNITLDTKYYYMVTAVNAAGEGPRSNEQNATPYAVPSAPTLTATAGNLRITLFWTIPSSNGASITNYSIYRGTPSGGETLFIKDYIGGTSWVDTNITAGITYYYMVSAVNAAGEGPRSNEKNLTAGNSPGVPTGLTASGGNAQVLLRWSAPASGGTPAHYNIYRSDSQTGTYTLIASPTTREYKDTGLTNGHHYWYKINAQNSYGISGNTTAVSAKPYVTSINSVGLLLLGLIIVISIVFLIVETMRLSRKKKA